MKKLLFPLACVLSIQLNAQLCFSPMANFATDSTGNAICSGDINGDGKPDLVTANFFPSDLSVLLGNGAGSFSAPSNIGTLSSPSGIVSTDFDSDGYADVAVVGYPGINVFLGNSTGTFTNSIYTPISTSYNPSALAIADFNSDGKTDIATANLAGNISVLLGNSNGHFTGPVNFNGGGGSWSIATADFDADGKFDLAVTNNYSTTVSVLMGTGTGTFGTPTTLSVGSPPGTLTAGDFNADGKADIAVTDTLGLVVFLSAGSGNFNSPVTFPAQRPGHVTQGDMNGDGILDLVATTNNDNVSVLLGNGAGGFSTPAYFAVDSVPYQVICADLNGDGKLDIATTNFRSKNVSVLLNCTAIGIENYNADQTSFVYPNPASYQFFVNLNVGESLSLDFYDINGRRVLSKNVNDNSSVSVADLADGIYSVVIKSATRIVNKKLIITR